MADFPKNTMKLTKIVNLMVLGLALAVVGTGCKKKFGSLTPLPSQGRTGIVDTQPPVNPPSPIIPEQRPLDFTQPPKTTETGGGTASNTDFSKMIPHEDILKSQTVYFDFDKSSIRSSEQPKLSEVANYLRSNAGNAVRVAGNCDERGTEEYNRSLGERRALAAREALVGMGISPDRIETVSYGEDKPAVQGHDESAYSKNRRDEFIVLTPP
jgi:peptidoglycan-associated lipoprotein